MEYPAVLIGVRGINEHALHSQPLGLHAWPVQTHHLILAMNWAAVLLPSHPQVPEEEKRLQITT